VRLARSADEIAVDGLRPPPLSPGKNYQLWIAPRETMPAQPLGLLPLTGRKIFAEAPSNIQLLTGDGELWVTLEAATGTLAEAPGGPPVFRATLEKRS
jgi:anti-sigma-K factor RskA